MKTKNMTTLHLRSSISPATSGRGVLLVAFAVALVLACFGLAPLARAVSPAPDGGYPGNNTAEGDDALFSLTSGLNNSAMGFKALYSNTSGGGNTATGGHALFNNTSGSENVAIGNDALINNTTGNNNIAIGASALANNAGDDNIAIG